MLQSPIHARPGVAIVCNSLPPYRIHFHSRIVREMPEIQLWTVCTQEGVDDRWQLSAPPEINPVFFGQPGVPNRHGINLASFRKGGQVIRWLRQNDIRAVVLLGYNDLCRIRIIRWCRRNRVPCFVFGDSNIRGDLATGLRAIIKRFYVGWVVRNTAGQLPCGTLGKAYFEKYGASFDRIYFMPYEPDYDRIHTIGQEDVDKVLLQHGLDKNRRRIVFSGRLVEAKRPDLLIRAFAAIAGQRPDWDLVFAGNGPLRSALEALIPPELTSRVFWAGFLSDQSALSALYRGCDLLTLPSNYEPWALVINEAAAVGLAIISSDVVGAAAELVREGINGMLFPSGNLEMLVRCMMEATDAQRIDALKSGSTLVLADWRRRADPVAGLRRALTVAGVLDPARTAAEIQT